MTTDKTTERLRILAEVGPALFAIPERQALLERACDYTVQALGLEALAILLVDRGAGVVRIVAQRNLPDFLLEIGRALPLGKGMAGWVAARGEAQIIEDAPADPRLANIRDDLLRVNIHGLVSVPMRWDDEVIGVVQGGVSRERAFGAEDAHTLTVLAGQIALALRNVERAEELKASEEKYRALFDAAHDAFFIIDLEGNYIDVNPAACQMVGYTRHELLTMNTIDLVPPEWPPRPLEERQAMWRRGGQMEMPLVSKTGARVPVDMTFSVIQYHGREAVLGVCRDISEHRRTEQEQARLVAILEATPDFVGFADAKDTHMLYINKAGRRMTGVGEDEDVTRLKISDVHPGWTNKLLREEVLPAAIRDGVWTGECAFLNRDGREIPVLMALLSHKSPEGEVEVFSTISRDITEQKQAEDTLRRNSRELAVRNRIAEIFLTISDEEMYTQVLGVLLETMHSKYGVFGYLDEQGNFVVPTMTRTIWDKCQVSDKRFVFPRETWGDSSWPRAIRQKQTICLNEPSTLTPEGHISIERHISLPIIHQGEVIGLFQIANKETDYTEEDIYLLEMIGGAVAPVLDARLKRERQEASRKQAEEQLKAYQAELEDKVRLLEAQQATIRELSTPVIQVWEGVLMLPLIGVVDSSRARQIMETLLTSIVETQSEIVILDISGVPLVDMAVANHLIKTVQAAQMLGARGIVTGLSPKVAQTVVELGVELTGITTRANLRAGLEMALGIVEREG